MKIFSLTDIGRKREVNQDYVYVTDKPVGHIPNLFVVADGMGCLLYTSDAADEIGAV